MRTTELWLQDIIEAGEAIEAFVAEVEKFEYFENSAMYKSAFAYQLVIIGEAAAQMPVEFRTSHPELEWQKMKMLRNFSVHQYFGVNWGNLWNTAVDDVPRILEHAIRIMGQEFPDF